MSTRSRIGILNSDGTVTSVYCHFDGYPTRVGTGLLEDHNSEEAARALIALGDLSSIGRGSVTAYTRDRGEDAEDNEAETHPIDRWPDSGMVYAYLWRDGEWRVSSGGDFVSVTDLIAKLAAEEEAE